MRKVLRVLRNIILGLLVMILIILAGVFVYHRIKISQEKVYLKNVPGQMVEVDGHKMHVYLEGQGEHTLVFMSGWADISPYTNFLPMAKDLSDENKIVIIEKFGYGFSDVVPGKRDFDTIIENDREALRKLGIEGPFVLCPHSYSGFEATLWAQKYPEEVEGIVGMDMSVTSWRESYVEDANCIFYPIYRVCRGLGITRLEGADLETEEDKMLYALIEKKEMNKNVLSENKSAGKVCDEIDSMPLPTAPTIQIISKELAEMDPEGWIGGHQALVDASVDGKLIKLDCGHYVYMDELNRVVKEIREFLKAL
ncbi:MAG: alpha/beta hydrolase [Butyrivibrio sp.]|nr:alpha/beta hydrolase [Butyrivibrio sp.]